MKIVQFINKILSSNSYILHNDFNADVWIIDPGDSVPLLNWITSNKKNVKGILITHSHVDHIYGVNDISLRFPELEIFTSKQSLSGFFSSKENGSYYMEMPYLIEHDKITIIEESIEIQLFNGICKAIVLNTPGHNNDCISFIVNDNIFTGDALIPGHRIHTKSKNSNKQSVINSIHKILSFSNEETLICPGHGDMVKIRNINIDDLINKSIRKNDKVS